MKYKTTNKDVKNYSQYILSVGYCGLAELLKYETPDAYTCGVYGWNYDVYEIKGVTICTGYRGMPKNEMMNLSYELLEFYEKKAREINNDCNLSYDKQKEKVRALLFEMLENAKK